MVNTGTRKTIDIENSGNSVVLNAYGRELVSLAIRGDGAASYRIDGREEQGADWVTGIKSDPNYTGQSEYDDTFETGWHQIRIYCTSGTATVDDVAEIVMSASGS